MKQKKRKFSLFDVSVPRHIAIIMDGNGRWAQERGRPRFFGHIKGAANVIPIVRAAYKEGVKVVTLYAFSKENWGRPQNEISSLFRILEKFLIRQKNIVLENKIHFKVIGDLIGLSEKTRKLILNLEHETSKFQKHHLNFAFDYGGQDEIIHAANRFFEDNPGKKLSKELFSQYLMTAEYPDLDFLIRTAGDQRISNFLLWQMAYAELYFTEKFWPDFSEEDLKDALKSFSLRKRRFGKI